MLTWEIAGPELPALNIKADSFDVALKKARMRNKNYCCGQVVDIENLSAATKTVPEVTRAERKKI